MNKTLYELQDTSGLISPALVYYREIILENTMKAIKMAGGPERLWPHVKSHKCIEMVRLQIGLGITRFKCATIAEAEMAAEAGASHIILAYPLIGPNIARYLRLASAPQYNTNRRTVFYAIGDNYGSLSELSAQAEKMQMKMNVLLDVDLGMHRTGISFDTLFSLYQSSSKLKGINPVGLHCYDGHCHERDFNDRKKVTGENDIKVLQIQQALRSDGLECEILVMGGTPTFPCRTGKKEFYLSPGTFFVNDWGYWSGFPDLDFTPGAAIFTRVVSHQGSNTFTLDLGHKGIGADPPGQRGIIAGLEQAKPLFQSEEHWVFSLPEGALPPIGSGQYVIPAHICPTSALYPEIQIAQEGKITGTWNVTARNRRITF